MQREFIVVEQHAPGCPYYEAVMAKANARSNSKSGSKPMSVSPQTFAANWDYAFKQKRTGMTD